MINPIFSNYLYILVYSYASDYFFVSYIGAISKFKWKMIKIEYLHELYYNSQ